MTAPFVRKLEGFGLLPETDKALIAEIGANAEHIGANTDLIREGDTPDGVFLVLDGFACRYKLLANGSRQIMAYLVPGDFCDLDVSLLSRMDHSLSTLSPCLVTRIAPETIREMLERPALARALRLATLVDAATAREWLVNAGRRSAPERLAHLLCELLSRMKIVGLAEQDSFPLPFTQNELADTTGLSLVHTNRSLQQLRGAGFVELRNRRLTILDLPSLVKFAGYRSNYLHMGAQVAA